MPFFRGGGGGRGGYHQAARATIDDAEMQLCGTIVFDTCIQHLNTFFLIICLFLQLEMIVWSPGLGCAFRP